MHPKLGLAQVLITTVNVTVQLFDPNLAGGHVGVSILILWQFIQRSSPCTVPKAWAFILKGLLFHPAAGRIIFLLAKRPPITDSLSAQKQSNLLSLHPFIDYWYAASLIPCQRNSCHAWPVRVWTWLDLETLCSASFTSLAARPF